MVVDPQLKKNPQLAQARQKTENRARNEGGGGILTGSLRSSSRVARKTIVGDRGREVLARKKVKKDLGVNSG